jgi:hypothetical protein
MTRALPPAVREDWIDLLTNAGASEEAAEQLVSIVCGDPEIFFKTLTSRDDTEETVAEIEAIVIQYDLQIFESIPGETESVVAAMNTLYRVNVIDQSLVEWQSIENDAFLTDILAALFAENTGIVESTLTGLSTIVVSVDDHESIQTEELLTTLSRLESSSIATVARRAGKLRSSLEGMRSQPSPDDSPGFAYSSIGADTLGDLLDEQDTQAGCPFSELDLADDQIAQVKEARDITQVLSVLDVTQSESDHR